MPDMVPSSPVRLVNFGSHRTYGAINWPISDHLSPINIGNRTQTLHLGKCLVWAFVDLVHRMTSMFLDGRIR